MRVTVDATQHARVLEVQRCSIHDGPGIRTTVFLAGCPLRCAWCHNPEAFAGARDRLRSLDEVLAEVLADRAFYQASGGGLTVSGGEPLLQPAFVAELLRRARGHGIHTCIQTAAHVPSRVLQDLAPLVDLFQIDLKHMDPERHRAITGVDNERILANIVALRAGGAAVELRMPVVPGWNDDERNLHRVVAFLHAMHTSALRLVPYQRAYLFKYRELGLPARCADVAPPSVERLCALKDWLATHGVTATFDA